MYVDSQLDGSFKTFGQEIKKKYITHIIWRHVSTGTYNTSCHIFLVQNTVITKYLITQTFVHITYKVQVNSF